MNRPSEHTSADASAGGRPLEYSYRCFAVLKENGRYTGWAFDRAEKEYQYRRLAQALNGIALASVQQFPQTPAMTGALKWKSRAGKPGTEEFFKGVGALPIWSPFYLDIDSADAPWKSLLFARAAAERFQTELGLAEGDVLVWFSGSKGFHLLVSPLALGIEPGVDLTMRYMRPMAIRLHRELIRRAAPAIEPDLSAYSLPRLLRLPGEINPKSGLFKIPLTLSELQEMELDEIRELATAPREIELPPGSTNPVAKAANWWVSQCAKIDEDRAFRAKAANIPGVSLPPVQRDEPLLATSGLPVCIRRLLRLRAPPGLRNRCELQLACWARASGKSAERANQILGRWSLRNRPEKPPDTAIREAAGVIRTVWVHNYHFSCLAARALLRDCGESMSCAGCPASRLLRTVSALRVGHIPFSHPELLTLEEAHEYLYRMVCTAFRN